MTGNRTRKVFAWGARSLRENENSNAVKRLMGIERSNRNKHLRAIVRGATGTPRASQARLGTVPWQNAIGHLNQRDLCMPRDRRLRARPQTDGTKTSGRFGPFAPMRGARGQAEAIQQGVYKPIMPTEARLQPAGRSYALTYHGYNKLRDWD